MPGTAKPSTLNQMLQSAIDDFFSNQPKGEIARGVSVGLVDASGGGTPVIVTDWRGEANSSNGTPVAQDTVFEIGSVSKTFTTTMLAGYLLDGSFSLTDTAQSCYDRFGIQVSLPTYPAPEGPQAMTLRDLGDYTSGLADKRPPGLTTPYGFSFDDMHSYLSGLDRLADPPGTKYRYVNTDFGILAELVLNQGGFADYGAALADLISGAGLEMPDTGAITSNTPTIPNLAQGHKIGGEPEPNYALPTWPAFLGAGGVYATIGDMLQWLQFNMGLLDSPWNDRLAVTQKVYFRDGHDTGNGLGWFFGTQSDGALRIDKNGGTGGFHAYMGFLPGQKIGVVALCNSAEPASAAPNRGKGPPLDNMCKDLLVQVNALGS